jgi:thiol-disulfide isomerase/thioredoxin
MNKKSRAVVCIVVLFLLIAAFIIYIFSELFTESEIKPVIEVTDALKFKEEYESLNGQTINDNEVRSLSIPEDNPFIYKTADEIVDMINNNETFLVYFGFASCPWCRSVITTMIESAKSNNIKTIYYVDISDIRDTYELNDNHEAVKTKEGSDGYYKLLELLSPVLEDYSALTYKSGKKTIKVNIDEKRIYAPSLVVVKNGNPISLETGLSESQENAYQELTDDILCDMEEKFNCLFDEFNSDGGTCSITKQEC